MKATVDKKIMGRPSKRGWLKIGSALFGIGMIASALFLHPGPLFGWSISADNLSLHSDRPFSPGDGRKMLERVQNKLKASPLYSSRDHCAIFICNAKWRRSIFFAANRTAGGLTYYPFSSNVFLSGAVIEENRLISPSGKPDSLGRSLDHFIAHEIAHVLTCRMLGWARYRVLPDWIKEGYAEYVGSCGAFDFGGSVRAFLAGAPKMNMPSSVPYLRYNLLVAYLLGEKKWSPARLFGTSVRPAEVETMLKREKSESNQREAAEYR